MGRADTIAFSYLLDCFVVALLAMTRFMTFYEGVNSWEVQADAGLGHTDCS
jgi:hypothetical protein